MLSTILFAAGAVGVIALVVLLVIGMKPIGVADKANQKAVFKKRLMLNKGLLAAFIGVFVFTATAWVVGGLKKYDQTRSLAKLQVTAEADLFDQYVQNFLDDHQYYEKAMMTDKGLTDRMSADELYDKAESFGKTNANSEYAVFALRKALSKNPQHAPSLTLMASFLLNKENIDAGSKAATLLEDYVYGMCQRFDFAISKEETKQNKYFYFLADFYLYMAIESAPDCTKYAMRGQGRLLSAAGLKLTDKVVVYDDDEKELQLVNVSDSLNSALDYFQKAISLEPPKETLISCYEGLGQIYEYFGETENAAAARREIEKFNVQDDNPSEKQ